MTPAQRGAETRRRNEAAARAAFLVERMPERKQECVEARAEVLRAARVFAALPMLSPATIDAAQKLSHAAGDLWSKLHWLADWTRELGELTGDSATVAKTIHDDVAKVVDLQQHRKER